MDSFSGLGLKVDSNVKTLWDDDRNLFFLEENLHLLDKVCSHRLPALLWAIFDADCEFIKKVLELGKTNLLHGECCFGDTPLNFALSLIGDEEGVEGMLQKESNKKIQSIAKMFLASGAEVNLLAPFFGGRDYGVKGYAWVKGQDRKSYSPLTKAANKSGNTNFELITLFLRRGAKTDWIEFDAHYTICQNIEKGMELVAQENYMLVLQGRVSSGSILNKIPREIVELILNCISGVMHKEQRCFRSQGRLV